MSNKSAIIFLVYQVAFKKIIYQDIKFFYFVFSKQTYSSQETKNMENESMSTIAHR